MSILRVLGFIFSLILGILAWLGQVAPEQAMSNYSGWYERATNLDAPAWMDYTYVDVLGSLILAVTSVAGFIWLFWPRRRQQSAGRQYGIEELKDIKGVFQDKAAGTPLSEAQRRISDLEDQLTPRSVSSDQRYKLLLFLKTRVTWLAPPF